jgi:threonine-phosphate decarboxylase
MIVGHGGNIFDAALKIGCHPSEIIDLSTNVNPLGPMDGLVYFLLESIHEIAHLPEVEAAQAVEDFASRYDLNPDRILAGNGTTQFIYTAPRALKSRKVLILGPAYADYADACRRHSVDFGFQFADADRVFQPDILVLDRAVSQFDTVFICNPNNPTGHLIPRDRLEELCGQHPAARVIIDESYLPFVENGEQQSMIHTGLNNVIVLYSMSKIFRIPGLRSGFVIAPRELIAQFRQFVLPWNVNSLAQAAVSYLMTHTEAVDEFLARTRTYIQAQKDKFIKLVPKQSGIHLFPSSTGYLLVRLPGTLTAPDVKQCLLEQKILIRDCSNFAGLSNRYIRFSLKNDAVDRMVAETLVKLASR